MRLYFNNHARPKSVRNAFLRIYMLSIEHKSKEVQLAGQVHAGHMGANQARVAYFNTS
jgi:hypothetical protein